MPDYFVPILALIGYFVLLGLGGLSGCMISYGIHTYQEENRNKGVLLSSLGLFVLLTVLVTLYYFLA